jgi:hypothetical protein
MKNYYQTLGLANDADYEVIREKLAFLLAEYANTEASKVLSEAQRVLLDPRLRKQYDLSLKKVDKDQPLPNLALLAGKSNSPQLEPPSIPAQPRNPGLLLKIYRNIRLVFMIGKLNWLWRSTKWYALSLLLDLWYPEKHYVLFHLPVLAFVCLNGTLVFSFWKILDNLDIFSPDLWPDDFALLVQCFVGLFSSILLAKAGWGIATLLALSQLIALGIVLYGWYSQRSQIKARRYKNFKWPDTA